MPKETYRPRKHWINTLSTITPLGLNYISTDTIIPTKWRNQQNSNTKETHSTTQHNTTHTRSHLHKRHPQKSTLPSNQRDTNNTYCTKSILQITNLPIPTSEARSYTLTRVHTKHTNISQRDPHNPNTNSLQQQLTNGLNTTKNHSNTNPSLTQTHRTNSPTLTPKVSDSESSPDTWPQPLSLPWKNDSDTTNTGTPSQLAPSETWTLNVRWHQVPATHPPFSQGLHATSADTRRHFLHQTNHVTEIEQ